MLPLATVESLLAEARVFAEALFASERGAPPSARLDWLVDELRDFVEHGGPRTELILRGGLALSTWTAPLLVGRAPPLSRLDVETRCRALDRLEHSPIGLPLLAVKAMLCILWYEHPDSMREIGIEPDASGSPGCRGPAEGGRS
jgi:hypothetical protein